MKILYWSSLYREEKDVITGFDFLTSESFKYISNSYISCSWNLTRTKTLVIESYVQLRFDHFVFTLVKSTLFPLC